VNVKDPFLFEVAAPQALALTAVGCVLGFQKQYVTQGKAAAVRPLAHGYAGPIADALAKTLLVLLCAHDELGERSTVL
jgi:hypothetical protein